MRDKLLFGARRALRRMTPYVTHHLSLLRRGLRRAGARRRTAQREIGGDPEHPANRGALCSKGSALGETVGLEGRLLQPAGARRTRSTGTARSTRVAQRLPRASSSSMAPTAVAFYVSGQLLTEDYYVANKLMKGFIGSANIDTNSRLCMSSAVAGHKRAFGEDLVPVTYEDLELADLIVLVGSNTGLVSPGAVPAHPQGQGAAPVAARRRHRSAPHADLRYRRSASAAARRHRRRAVQWPAELAGAARLIGPRHSSTAHTRGGAQALLVAENTAGDVGCGGARLRARPAGAASDFYELFGGTERVVTLFSQGVNQSSAGTDKANSIINAHLLTGRIGRPGMGPFSITGQPNAMGGREVGGTGQHARRAHGAGECRRIARIVQDFWDGAAHGAASGPEGRRLVRGDARADASKRCGSSATNPVVSLPNADRAREALRRCELVVVSDCVAHTDTTALAHVLLPAAAWGEKDGTVTNSERHISRQRAFLPRPATPAGLVDDLPSRAAAGIRRWRSAIRRVAEIFDEHARLSRAGNDGTRAFDHRRPCGPGRAGLRGLGAHAVAARDAAIARPRRGCSPTAASTTPTAGRAWCRRCRASASIRPGSGISRWCSTPGGSAINGTP